MKIFRYSAIDTSQRCLQKYKLQYLDQIPMLGDPSIDLEFGTAMHSALNACLEGEDPLIVFNTVWDTFKDTQFAKSRDDWGSLKAAGEVLLARFERLHSKHFVPMQMETKLKGKLGPHDIEGTPDYVGLYKGLRSIVDFKTSGYEYMKERLIVGEQMPIYANLVQQNHDYPIEQIVYYVFIKREQRIQVLTAPLTKELFDSAINNAILQCNELVGRQVFPKNPSSCMMGTFKCPFFERCHG